MKRATDDSDLLDIGQDISIHALVKRATTSYLLISRQGVISIHALVKRATASSVWLKCHLLNFNPRPREEGDTFSTDTQREEKHFNPRPREEGDCTWSDSGLGLTYISIHALVKRATLG